MINIKIRRIGLIVTALILILSTTTSAQDSSQTDTKDSSDDPLVSLSYVNEVLKPQIIEEVLSSVKSGGTYSGSTYCDITAKSGKMIMLGANCEFIYRGGGAVIITTSPKTGDGVSDMSMGNEYFSGKPLEFGHVYYASDSDAEKYILITGNIAYFTIRGVYEIV